MKRDLELEATIVEKYAAVEAVLDERGRRRWAAAESRAIGFGGDSLVSAATGLSRPTIRAGDAGFDRLEIETSAILGEVGAVRIAEAPVPFAMETEGPHRLAVNFPRLQEGDSGALVEVDFTAQVLRYGATFAAHVSNSERPLDVPQGVNAGDATAEYEGDRVSVATAAQEQGLLQVQVESAVFTPNGDGKIQQKALVKQICRA